MIRFSSLRARLVGTVFIAVVIGWLVAFIVGIEIAGFAAGLLALAAAWFGGERFIIRQVRVLLETTTRLARGNLSARTGFAHETGELGELARSIDRMAETLEERAREREAVDRALRTRAQQQTAVAALGQFALTTNDVDALMGQSVNLVSQTLEVDFCEVLEFDAHRHEFTLRASAGWKEGLVGQVLQEATPDSLPGCAIKLLEAIRVQNYHTDQRFPSSTLARSHGAVSGVTVPIIGQNRKRPYGVLGAHLAKPHEFTDDDEQFLRAVANLLAMTFDRKRAEAEIQKRAVFAQLNPTPAVEITQSGKITYANDAAFKLAHETGRTHPRELLPENVLELVDHALESGQNHLSFDTQLNGRTLSWLIHPVSQDHLVHCYITDTTEQVKLEASLRQADKMLAIGQLAAGVAHDFNNMLTVIQGHAGILLKKAGLTASAQDSAEAIYFAAERAAGLTRQLLMFSRKNVKQTVPLDLTQVVQGMSDMLRRLLGETVILEFSPTASLPRMDGDKNEIEQVIMNLVVNARDAMPAGGSVCIHTKVTQLNEEDIHLHPQGRPGTFIRLDVSDTGTGMDQATINRIFEPFFTTKEVGKGTGLGLATVYGIVKQHEGWVEVASEVGTGTTFSVYLPVAARQPDTEVIQQELPINAPAPGGDETILVVEDEPELREMAVQILESFGYKHLQAASAAEALALWKSESGAINLVLTDMVMPGGMSGRDLAKQLIRERPRLPVVIASGYSVDDISDELSGNKNITFVQKPYNLDVLARAIRNALDAQPRSRR
ncbi:MAG TPA: ATP-binding protein [Verrucomicrobiae bacterium]|nr:ATP-binding protein [Verrucomicrobiae bacterium]